MKLLASRYNLDDFFSRLKSATSRGLLLDYDGTLAPFRVEREQAVPYEGVPGILSEILSAGHSRVVIVSGRSASEIPPLLGMKKNPEIWGAHGWERMLPDGHLQTLQPAPREQEALHQAWTMIERHDLSERSERKAASIALHWRGVGPESLEPALTSIREAWDSLTEISALSIRPFDGGIELRAKGQDKGDAVTTLLQELGPDAVTAYFGDDQTDEDAFRAVANGGLSVLVRPSLRPTAAHLWLSPPVELIDFLNRWHQESSSKS